MVIDAMRMNHDHVDQCHARTTNWEAFTFFRRRVWHLLVVKCCRPLQRLKQSIIFFRNGGARVHDGGEVGLR